MSGFGHISAKALSVAYVPAMVVRGAVSGAVATASILGVPGDIAGKVAGRSVSYVLGKTCKLLNKLCKTNINVKKHQERTITAFRLAGAAASAIAIGTLAAVTFPVSKTVLCALACPVIGMAGNAFTALKSRKGSYQDVYQELRKHGTSKTAKENLFGRFQMSIINDILDEHGKNLRKPFKLDEPDTIVGTDTLATTTA